MSSFASSRPNPASSAQRSPWTTQVQPETLSRLATLITLADETDRERLPVAAPFTGEEVATVPAGTAADVEAAVDRARGAQPAWAEQSIRDRAAVLQRFRGLILDREAFLCDLIGLEGGKPRYHCFSEIYVLAEMARYYARHGEGILGEDRRAGPIPGVTAVRVRHRPVGVVGIIGPWNVPFDLTVGDALPALLAGNTVVVKPAEQTPFSALAGAELLYEAGLPRDAFHVVTGTGEATGAAIVDTVDFVSFTGGTRTARQIGERAGRRGIGCSLELGGKNPMVVLSDVELDKTLERMVQGCFGNSGQVCMAPERIYVETTVYDEFLARFTERVERLTLGASFDYAVEVGSLISEAHLAKVAAHVDDAVAKGATVLTGGQPRPDIGPTVYEPTVLADVTEEMTLYAEETFGPVVSVYRVEDVEEAIKRANQTPYRLNASVWTSDRRRGASVARRLNAGMVAINDAYAVGYAAPAAPMGGTKGSGTGRRHGPEGLLKYTVPQTIARNRGMTFVPSGEDAEGSSRRLLRLLRFFGRVPGLR